MNSCLHCNSDLKNQKSVYCSNRCQKDFEYEDYVRSWLDGRVSGKRGIHTSNFSGHVVRYINEKYSHECARCHWSEVNLATGRSPLEIDHIDGNPENSNESNLILLCPNCHSLTLTYKNLNNGNGRGWRRAKYVKIV
jgi:hypothetical protein